jgi:hypothetical protein
MLQRSRRPPRARDAARESAMKRRASIPSSSSSSSSFLCVGVCASAVVVVVVVVVVVRPLASRGRDRAVAIDRSRDAIDIDRSIDRHRCRWDRTRIDRAVAIAR